MITAALTDLPVPGDGVLRSVTLREISAAEELEAGTASALLSALYLDGTVTPAEMTLSEQDMAIAALYRSLYGESVEFHVPCASCDRKFETQFDLSDWIASLRNGPEVARTGPNSYRIAGTAFRLPVKADLVALGGLPVPDRVPRLRNACVLEGDPEAPELEAAMMRAGPLLDDDIEATCPHCGHRQTFPFRLDTYLLSALERERPVILREIHHIAAAYRWPRSEIVALPRSMRREHVRLILSERAPRGVSSWR